MRLQLDDPPLVWILKFEVTRIVRLRLARPKVRERRSRWRLCQPQRPAAHRLCGDATFDLCSSARAPRMHPANTGLLINLR